MLTPSSRSSSIDVLDRAEHRAQGDDDRLGVVGCGTAGPARPSSRPNACRELGRDLGDHVERLHLLGVREVLDLEERLGADHRADRHRFGRVEHLARLERAAGRRRPAPASARRPAR